MFIARTRVVQIGDADRRVFQNPRVVWTSGDGVAVELLADAMALVPAPDRPPPGDWWMYAVQWEPRAHVLPVVNGVLPYAIDAPRIVLFLTGSFWLAEADRLASLPPVVINSWEFAFSRKPRDFGQTVLDALDRWLINATWANWTGDRRDMARLALASTNPADDPAGVLSNQKLQQLNGTPRNYTGVWRM